MSRSESELRVLTHDGEFHADEVLGVALIRKFLGPIKLIRSRDPQNIQKAEIVLDVGGVFDPRTKRFDHHQRDYQGELASAGMVLRFLADEKHLEEGLVAYFYRILIRGVDLQDNGLQEPQSGIFSFSNFVQSYNPLGRCVTSLERDSLFNEAVLAAEALLDRLQSRYEKLEGERVLFREALEARDPEFPMLLVFPQTVAWKDVLWEEDTADLLFVIYPDHHEKWVLHTIPENAENLFSSRVLLPENWAGHLEKELAKATGIPEAIFCHKRRFIAAFKTQEAAILAAKRTLTQKDSPSQV